MAKESWSAKLKRELAEAKQEIAAKNAQLEQALAAKNIGKKSYQTIVWCVLAFIAGAIIF